MPLRKTIFWLHLVTGLIAGISIGIMCFTGTALAFEKQLVGWSERDARQVPAGFAGQPRLALDELTRRVREAAPDSAPTAIIVSSDPQSAVIYSLGRDRNVFVNPYTGAVLLPSSTKVRDFMRVMVEWHRFLSLSEDQRPTGKLINGVCNIAFFVLAVTGLYIWIPRKWSWPSVRAISLFNRQVSGKARDFNWHNVIGLWSAPILVVLTLSAIPISFRWGTNLVYQIVGEEPPAQPGSGATAPPPVMVPPPTAGTPLLSREAQIGLIQKEFPTWEQITLRLAPLGRGAEGVRTQSPAGGDVVRPANTAATDRSADRPAHPPGAGASPRGPKPATFVVKTSDGWPRTATSTIELNPFTGDILRREAFGDQSAGRQLRSWTRFLHTGEALGGIGQLFAGLASLGGCFLVYTGVALAWRRFFPFGRGRSAAPTTEKN